MQVPPQVAEGLMLHAQLLHDNMMIQQLVTVKHSDPMVKEVGSVAQVWVDAQIEALLAHREHICRSIEQNIQAFRCN